MCIQCQETAASSNSAIPVVVLCLVAALGLNLTQQLIHVIILFKDVKIVAHVDEQ